MKSRDIKLIQAIRILKDKLKKSSFEIRFKDDEEETMVVEIPIGSKTGTGELRATDFGFSLETRYNQHDYIPDDEDLLSGISAVAWDWYIGYGNRSPFEHPSNDWREIWIKEGRLKKVTKTTEEYQIV